MRGGIYFALFWLALSLGCQTANFKIENAVSRTSEKISRDSRTNSIPAAARFFIHEPKIHISTWKKLNPIFWLGNANEPEPPADYLPQTKHRRLKWYLRNPFHNFDHYVIGIADKKFVRVGKFPADVFNPDGGWNRAVCQYKFFRLPFISYQGGRFEFYFGWRESGNFGISFRKKSPPD